MKTVLFALFLVFIVTPANAAPVYLDCYAIQESGNKIDYQITVDESTKKITHRVVGTGHTINTEGFFTSDKITYQEKGAATSIYEIDRMDLSYKMKFAVSDILSVEGNGMCEIKEVDPNRKL